MDLQVQKRQEDWRQAHIDLLDKPALIALEDPESFRRVLYYEKQLKEWYQGKMGWLLVRSRSMIRLHKEPAFFRSDCALPGLFEVMDFILFTSILWYSETLRHRSIDLGMAVGSQYFVLSQLAETIEKEFFPFYLPGQEFNLTHRNNRQSLVRAIRSLMKLGAVHQVEGDDTQWSQNMAGDVLYEFTEMSYRLLAGIESRTDSLSPEQHAWRTLLLGPVLYRIDDQEAFDWVVEHRESIGRQLRDRYGDWNLLVAKDYACILRTGAPSGGGAELLHFLSAISHPLLLICAAIRNELQDGNLTCHQDGYVLITDYWLESHLAKLKNEHGTSWGSRVGKLPLGELKKEVLDEMMNWDMVRPMEDEHWQVLPLTSRFYPKYVVEGVESYAEND